MALNRTREVLKIWDETLRDARLSWFTSKKLVVGVDFVGEDINEIFGNYVSRSMAFSSEIGNLKVVYYHTIHERKE